MFKINQFVVVFILIPKRCYVANSYVSRFALSFLATLFLAASILVSPFFWLIGGNFVIFNAELVLSRTSSILLLNRFADPLVEVGATFVSGVALLPLLGPGDVFGEKLSLRFERVVPLLECRAPAWTWDALRKEAALNLAFSASFAYR